MTWYEIRARLLNMYSSRSISIICAIVKKVDGSFEKNLKEPSLAILPMVFNHVRTERSSP